MDQADGYASFMLKIKNKTSRNRKTRAIIDLRGRQEMNLCLCCAQLYKEKYNSADTVMNWRWTS